jgi:putative endonuclease
LHPADTVDEHKQRRIVQVGQQFLQQRRMLDGVNCRFDVIAITGPAHARKIEWIKDAFDA